MKAWQFSWLPTILFLVACGGGGGDSGPGGGDSYPISTVSWRVPDTGQTSCYYDYTVDGLYNPTEVSFCPAPGTSAWGPDGQDGYYKINPPSFTDNGDGTVLDSVTGLTWRKCALGRSGSDCMTGASASYTWSSAMSQCASLGAGWRLPTVVELTRLVNYGTSYTSIDESFFPATAPSPFWTSTPHATRLDVAWYVNFAQGNTWSHYKSQTYYVRCVRG